ncbi:MAG: hypothetical protein ABI430_04180 [Candidatus Taylorbacteria bacterium]
MKFSRWFICAGATLFVATAVCLASHPPNAPQNVGENGCGGLCGGEGSDGAKLASMSLEVGGNGCGGLCGTEGCGGSPASLG